MFIKKLVFARVLGFLGIVVVVEKEGRFFEWFLVVDINGVDQKGFFYSLGFYARFSIVLCVSNVRGIYLVVYFCLFIYVY